MSGHSEIERDKPYVYEPWYKYGIAVLFLEAAIAVGVSIFSISMGLSGNAVQFKKTAVFEKKTPVVAPAAPATQGMAPATPTAPDKCNEQQSKDCQQAAPSKP